MLLTKNKKYPEIRNIFFCTSMPDNGTSIYRRLLLRTSLCTVYIYTLGPESLFMKIYLLLKKFFLGLWGSINLNLSEIEKHLNIPSDSDISGCDDDSDIDPWGWGPRWTHWGGTSSSPSWLWGWPWCPRGWQWHLWWWRSGGSLHILIILHFWARHHASPDRRYFSSISLSSSQPEMSES